jgi:lipoyl(octanoyl) transferase
LQHYPENVQIFDIERGGDVTFHGPGQLVGYPILDLKNYKKSISWYMRSLEEVIIDTLDIYGLEAIRKDGLTGVWIGDEKIAALGVRISRWVTMHGFALNVNTDLNYYDGIIPCGILEYGVTSMEKLLDCKISMDDIKNNLISCFRNIFINELIPVNL